MSGTRMSRGGEGRVISIRRSQVMEQKIGNLLRQAIVATSEHRWDERDRIIQELVVMPQDLFAAMPEIHHSQSKGLQAITAEAFRVMGYPANEPATSFLIDAASNANRPAYFSAFAALQAMPIEAIAPYALSALWDRKQPSAWREEAILDICFLLLDLDDKRLDLCGPTVAYLLSSPEQFNDQVTNLLVGILDAIGVDDTSYAIPALIHLAQQSPHEVVRLRAVRLLSRYPADQTATYRLIMPQTTQQEG